MKKRLISRLVLPALLVLGLAGSVVVAPDVLAVPNACADVETSIIPCDNRGGNPIMNLFLEIVNFLAIGVGIVVVGGIVWGGITIVRSNGNSSVMQQGVTIIVNAVIGLLLFIFMYAIINFLVPGGLFS